MRPLSRTQLNQPLIPERLGTEEDLRVFIAAHPSLFVITGAGISHASGIPVYRDEIGTWKGNTPIQHGDFLAEESTRKRYWARSFRGWPTVNRAKPNSAHQALADLEDKGYVSTLVTQNIDRLHQRAGHRDVIDLHGRLDEVLCMDCATTTSRAEIQERLERLNPNFEELQQQALVPAPDGDAEVSQESISQVVVPDCPNCAGVLKPNVVFYGGSVNKEKVNNLYDRLQQASAVLVVGSSLMVYSSYRFCKFADDRKIPIVCVNKGLTRADAMYQFKVNAECGQTLQAVAASLPALDD